MRCERLEVVDSDGKLLAMLGTDADGTRGLFVYDNAGVVRAVAVYDNSQSAFYAFYSTGTILRFFDTGGKVTHQVPEKQ